MRPGEGREEHPGHQVEGRAGLQGTGAGRPGWNPGEGTAADLEHHHQEELQGKRRQSEFFGYRSSYRSRCVGTARSGATQAEGGKEKGGTYAVGPEHRMHQAVGSEERPACREGAACQERVACRPGRGAEKRPGGSRRGQAGSGAAWDWRVPVPRQRRTT